MSKSVKRVLTRRVLLGGAALTGAGAVLAPALIANADDDASAARPLSDDALHAAASDMEKDLIELRRDLHAHPETAGNEKRTAKLVVDRLRKAGLEVTPNVGGHGVVGVLKGAHPGRIVAYRADMDAVAPHDQIPGGTEAEHICGHDVHVTVGVGIAEVLATLRDRLAGTVVFVFQPAEEALTGAMAMIEDGALDDYGPEEIHALHTGPFPVGDLAVMPGYGLPGRDEGTVTLTGPDAAKQAQELAAEIAALSTVPVPQTSEDIEQQVADVLTPDGPYAEFVNMRARANDEATVELSYRCWPEDRYTDIRTRIRGLAESYEGAAVEFPGDPFPAMVVAETDGRAEKRFLHHTVGRDHTLVMHACFPFNGEDFAHFLNRIPGTFTFLGVRKPGADIKSSYPHFREFDPDEQAIGHGVRAMAAWLAYRAHR